MDYLNNMYGIYFDSQNKLVLHLHPPVAMTNIFSKFADRIKLCNRKWIFLLSSHYLMKTNRYLN
jgi:hypothetical protein